MSFTEQVKNELARIPREDAGSRAAELLALLRMSGSFITGAHASWGLEFSTGNSAVARRVLVYLKKDFGFMPSTMVRQGRRLRKKNVYTLLVQPSKEGLHFLDTMGLSPLSGADCASFSSISSIWSEVFSSAARQYSISAAASA